MSDCTLSSEKKDLPNPNKDDCSALDFDLERCISMEFNLDECFSVKNSAMNLNQNGNGHQRNPYVRQNKEGSSNKNNSDMDFGEDGDYKRKPASDYDSRRRGSPNKSSDMDLIKDSDSPYNNSKMSSPYKRNSELRTRNEGSPSNKGSDIDEDKERGYRRNTIPNRDGTPRQNSDMSLGQASGYPRTTALNSNKEGSPYKNDSDRDLYTDSASKGRRPYDHSKGGIPYRTPDKKKDKERGNKRNSNLIPNEDVSPYKAAAAMKPKKEAGVPRKETDDKVDTLDRIKSSVTSLRDSASAFAEEFPTHYERNKTSYLLAKSFLVFLAGVLMIRRSQIAANLVI